MWRRRDEHGGARRTCRRRARHRLVEQGAARPQQRLAAVARGASCSWPRSSPRSPCSCRRDGCASLGAVGVLAGLVAITGGSAAYALNTAATPHTGSTPSAGPTVQRRRLRRRRAGRRDRAALARRHARRRRPERRGAGPPSGFTPPSGGTAPAATRRPDRRRPRVGGGAADHGVAALVTLLKNAGTTWSAATIGSQSAAPLELQSGTAVMAIGGFSGSDAAPTLAQFKALVAAGKIHYFIGGGQGGGPGGRAAAVQRDHAAGCSRTSRPRPSAARPSTTSRKRTSS